MFWHSLVIALIPSALAVVLLIRYRSEMAGNWLVFWLAFALSFAQGRPEIQDVYAVYGRSIDGLYAYAMPFFAFVYLFFGRFESPSIPLAWAGTYFCMMVTDLSFSYFQWRVGPFDLPLLLSGIGGGGWLDGLVVLPLAVVAITLFVRWKLRHGHVFWSMVGRRRFMSERQLAIDGRR